MKRIQTHIAILSLFALVLNGCSNIFFEKPQEKPEQETASPDILEGFGAIRVNFYQGEARTVMPMADLNVLYLEYLFTKDGGTAEDKTPEDDIFILAPGNYTLEVKAFVDIAKQELAAQGQTETPFTIIAGTDAGAIGVALHPVASGEGTGSLQFGLKYPAGTTVETLTLTNIAGTEDYNLMIPAPGTSGSDPITLSGTKADIPVGYYILRVGLRNSAGEYAGKAEAVHIYQNLNAKTDLTAYTFTAANFSAYLYMVNTTNDSGPGSLRQALADMNASTLTSSIRVMLEPGSVIELASALPEITRNLSIEGNSVTLTRSAVWNDINDTSQLLRIANGATVTIRRVHFKKGRTTGHGGAIYNWGNLTLESCIFSGNQIIGNGSYSMGGAIYNDGNSTIRGCTFYENTAGYRGGVVYSRSALIGNLFYGNTDQYGGSGAVGSNITTLGYNLVDIPFGTTTSQCGWSQGTGDLYSTALPVWPQTFKLLNGSPAAGRLPSTLPVGYPATDFYGQPISGGGAAGAVQAVAETGYSYLELTANNSRLGDISADPAPNGNGMVPDNSSILITATPSGETSSFDYWLVDGIVTSSPNPYSLTITGHTWIEAVFSPLVNTFGDAAGSDTTPGTLRYALINVGDGHTIYFSGTTPGITVIELEGPLPEITKSIALEGNGVTLTRAASWTDINETSQLLRVTSNSAEVKIRRVHFKDGLSDEYGAAIQNSGTLTLESCIFNGNQSFVAGAVYNYNTLTFRGCTFYGNTATNISGAVQSYSGNLTLTGNLFYENTANSYPVVRRLFGTVIASYNVVDIAFGTTNAQVGWDAGTGDTTFSDLSIYGDPFDTTTFVPVNGLRIPGVLPATAPADFPTTDFYGNQRTFPGAPGAVN